MKLEQLDLFPTCGDKGGVSQLIDSSLGRVARVNAGGGKIGGVANDLMFGIPAVGSAGMCGSGNSGQRLLFD